MLSSFGLGVQMQYCTPSGYATALEGRSLVMSGIDQSGINNGIPGKRSSAKASQNSSGAS